MCIMQRNEEQEQETTEDDSGQTDYRERIRRLDEETDRELGRRI